MTLGKVDAQDKKSLLRQALVAIEELQSKLDASERSRREPIAIVGMSCRLPGGVDSPETLWSVLDNGVDAVTEVPADRWNIDDYYDPDPKAPGRICTRRGGFLSQVDQFDPKFFGISPREAASMDPQQRLLLEVTWEALERAAQPPDRLQGSLTGVFVGITTNDYADLVFADPAQSDVYAATGNALNAAAGRIAFTLGLQGPCMAMDTACSSSLVALHMACLSLRAGESDMALAGGVNVMLVPDPFILFSKWGMIAPDGRCKTFDARADGFVRGEGCVVVVLKRLSDAVANGDNVLAVIRGSAVNQDGRSSGLTVPNGPAQQAVVKRALAAAGLKPADLSYVEAHGTGTPLGDPIEVEALAAALGAGRDAANPLLIGSIKTNIGHVEAASGLAGLMKVVLALQHGRIPRHLHFSTPNPRIAWDSMPVRVVSEPIDWARGDRARLAGVSSFGFTGTNAHVILEEAPTPAGASTPDQQGRADDRLQVLTLSARSEASLAELASRFATFVERTESNIADVCFSANGGRARHPYRLATIAGSASELVTQLRAVGSAARADGLITGEAAGSNPKIAFLFTGQGSQYAGMGRTLYDAESVFRAAVDRCCEALQTELPLPLLDVLFGGQTQHLDETQYTQPALFTIEYALAQLWRSWNVVPDVVLGHSVGEYVAATIAGIMELSDALRLIAARGRLMQALPAGGTMVSVLAPEEVVAAAVQAAGDRIAIAAVNAPESIVISGDAGAVQAAAASLAGQGYKTQPLTVSHAFHSPLMEPMLADFERIAASITYHAPKIGFVSNETGSWIRGREVNAAYWKRHVRCAVQYARSIAEVRAKGCDLFVEVGPAPTLIALGRRSVDGGTWVPSIRAKHDARKDVLKAAATLYTRGVEINWAAIASGRRIELPHYPFERERFWTTPPAGSRSIPTQVQRTPQSLAGRRLPSPLTVVQFERLLQALPGTWLAEHVTHGVPLVPAACYFEIALAAAKAAAGTICTIDGAEIHEPLALQPDTPTRVHTILERATTGDLVFRIASQPADDALASWQVHASGTLSTNELPGALAMRFPDSLAELQVRCPELVDTTHLYDELGSRGLVYGPAFRGLSALWRGHSEALGQVALPPVTGDSDIITAVHPALLGACFHVITGAIAGDDASGGYVPVGCGRVEMAATVPRRVWSHATVREHDSDPNERLATIRLFDDAGNPVGVLSDLRLKYIVSAVPGTGQDPNGPFYQVHWQEQLPAQRDASPPSSRTAWLVVTNDAALGAAVSADERVARGRVLTFDLSNAPRVDDAESRLAAALAAISPEQPLRVLFAATGGDSAGGNGSEAAVQLLRVARSLSTLRRAAATQLVVVTRGAAATEGEPVDPAQAAVAGLMRAAARELASIACIGVDLSASSHPRDGVDVIDEALCCLADEEVVRRGQQRLVRRLRRMVNTDSGPDVVCQPDATYLVTGGFGGLGLEVARWLADRGARRIVLAGRNAPRDHARAVVDDLRGSGVHVDEAIGDVSSREFVSVMLASIAGSGFPLKGVVHAAGVLRDAPLDGQTEDRFREVWTSKVAGARHLHECSLNETLDFFVLFSSFSSILGAAAQANYAAANSYLDALAHARRCNGRPAISLNWGPWSDVGMAARLSSQDRSRWTATGIKPFSTRRGIEMLEQSLRFDTSQVAIIDVDWKTLLQSGPRDLPALSDIKASAVAHAPAESRAIRSVLAAAAAADVERLVLEYVTDQISAVVQIPSAVIDPAKSIMSLGFDSLMGVELKARLESDLRVQLPIGELLQGPTAHDLAKRVLLLIGDTNGGRDQLQIESPAAVGMEEGEL